MSTKRFQLPSDAETNETDAIFPLAPDLDNDFAGFAPERRTLRLDFRGVPLQAVFDYIGGTAGFFLRVNPNVDVTKRVNIWNPDSLTRTEALDHVQRALKEHGCTAIQDGRMLTIVRNEDIKKSCIPLPLVGATVTES